MAFASVDDYRRMDEEYGNNMEHLWGPSLCTWPEDCDSARMYMFNSNQKQILVLDNPEVAHIMTGYENTFGKYNHAFKRLDGLWEVKDIIPKYGNNIVYTIILYNEETDTYDMVEKQCAENLTEKFGYKYNTSVMDSLKIGDRIGDTVLYRSTSYDDSMNYRMGVNANVMYTTDTATIEDAIKISKSFADKVKTSEVDEVVVSLNSNDVLLNLFGDFKPGPNEYKAFPDIGEHIDDVTVCARRRVDLSHIRYDFLKEQLQTISATGTDIEYVAPKESMIYDIDIYYNGDEEFPDNIYYRQLKKYYDMECEYAQKITDAIHEIKRSGSKYTDQVNYYLSKYRMFNNKEYKWKYNDRAFANIVLVFKTVATVSLEEGFKLTGRYGDKGIISEIITKDKPHYQNATNLANTFTQSLLENAPYTEDAKNRMSGNITIVDDCSMPYTDDGIVVDIELNSSGAIRRLNSGQLYEVEINFIGENLRRYIKTLETREEKLKVIFRFLELLNQDEANFYYNLYQSFDRVVAVDGTDVRLFDPVGQENFVKDIEDHGFYLIKKPSANIRYDVLKTLYEEWPWIKPYQAYIDLFGIKHKPLIRPVVIGSKYILVLKQTANKNFSARSTGRLDKKGLPAKSNDKKTNLAPYNNNPIKIGEIHNLLSSLYGQDIAEYDQITRSSPLCRKDFAKRVLKATGDPFKIEDIKMDHSYVNVNAQILNAYLKTMGIRIHLVSEEDEAKQSMSEEILSYDVHGVKIIDYGYRKPVYKAILDRYFEYMEKYIYIGPDINEKKQNAWDYVFSQKEIQDLDLKGLTRDDFRHLFDFDDQGTNNPTEDPNYEESSDDDDSNEE